MGRFLVSIAIVLGSIRLLALAKPLNGIKLIAMGEVLYELVNRTLCFQLWKVLFFICCFINLVSQLGVYVKWWCMVFKLFFNVHLDWVVLQVDVVHIFNSILHKVIF